MVTGKPKSVDQRGENVLTLDQRRRHGDGVPHPVLKPPPKMLRLDQDLPKIERNHRCKSSAGRKIAIDDPSNPKCFKISS